MRLRKTNPGDLPQLKALWALGFGDTEQEIEAFFETFGTLHAAGPIRCAAASLVLPRAQCFDRDRRRIQFGDPGNGSDPGRPLQLRRGACRRDGHGPSDRGGMQQAFD